MKDFEDVWDLINTLEPGVMFELGTKVGLDEDGRIIVIRPSKPYQVYSLKDKPDIKGFITISGFEFFLEWKQEGSAELYWPKVNIV